MSVISLAGLALIAAGLVLAAVHLLGQAKRLPREAENPRIMKAFHWVNGTQWVVCFVLATILGRMHHDVYIVPAIACIVGLHLFPLAKLFRYSMHYLTGAAMVLWAVGAMVVVPSDRVQGITALGAGVILWLSAATTLALAMDTARKIAPQMGSQGSQPA
jgi:4-hydroxybenzoate polyprenyltransferase